MPETNGKYRGAVLAFLVLLTAGVLALSAAMIYVVDKAQKQSQENARTLAAVLDCTVEGGKCFKESSDRTAEAVTGIGDNTYRVIVAALSCEADGIVDEEPLARCVAQRAQKIRATG